MSGLLFYDIDIEIKKGYARKEIVPPGCLATRPTFDLE